MPSVVVRSVTKSFAIGGKPRSLFGHMLSNSTRERRYLFRDLSFTAEPGEKVLIVGRNGSGKTTLLRMTAGLIPWDRGEILLGERPPQHFDRKQLGLMISTTLLYAGLTGYENLNFSARLYKCPDPEEMISIQAKRWGLENYLDQVVQSYSNGMKVALALARATIHQPKVLLLDEPTAFLDSTGIERLIQYLKWSTQTVLITSQQPNLFDKTISKTVRLQ